MSTSQETITSIPLIPVTACLKYNVSSTTRKGSVDMTEGEVCYTLRIERTQNVGRKRRALTKKYQSPDFGGVLHQILKVQTGESS